MSTLQDVCRTGMLCGGGVHGLDISLQLSFTFAVLWSVTILPL